MIFFLPAISSAGSGYDLVPELARGVHVQARGGDRLAVDLHVELAGARFAAPVVDDQLRRPVARARPARTRTSRRPTRGGTCGR